MIDLKQPNGTDRFGSAGDYRRVFVRRVHEILEGGYRRLNHSDYATQEEPAITGDLKREMKAYLRDDAAALWADHFFVQEEEPVNDGVRKGKSRKRIDITVEISIPRPGASFRFEAKRLARGYSVGKYLGPEGLGCFICGDYARDDEDAGMIGYVQDDSAARWAVEIEKTLRADPEPHEVDVQDCWKTHVFPDGPHYGFASTHARKAVGRPIIIYHSLLPFNPRGLPGPA